MNSSRFMSVWVLVLLGACFHASVQADTGGSRIKQGQGQLSTDRRGVEQMTDREGDDLKRIELCRQSLDRLISFASSNPGLFPREKLQINRMLSTAQRERLRSTWQSFLDCCFVLAAVEAAHSDFYKLDDRNVRKASFCVHYAAFLAQYRYAMAFLEITENDPTFDVVLNEADADVGLPEKSFAAFKFRFLNVAIASRFVALNTIAAHYGPSGRKVLDGAIETDRDYIWEMGRGKGEKLTLSNALAIAKRSGFSAILPVQEGIAEWMGDTKVWRKDSSLIDEVQIHTMRAVLEPGDILFERREWYLSNIGLPGFWPHVALYVGTPEERRAYFKNDRNLCRWFKEQGEEGCDIEALLQKRSPEAYRNSVAPQEQAHHPRVIEAISEGVSFTTLEHSAACDSLAVLRPRLSKTEKALAVLRAFDYYGRPYDFNFDFLTDASLVCSELIYKSYESSNEGSGLALPIVDMMGRKLTPPNEIVRQFSENYATAKQQMDLVCFLDGNEAMQKAMPATIDVFRESWRRPKWHIFLQQEE